METVQLAASVAAKEVGRYKPLCFSVWNLKGVIQSVDDEDRRESRLSALSDHAAKISSVICMIGPYVIDDLCQGRVHLGGRVEMG